METNRDEKQQNRIFCKNNCRNIWIYRNKALSLCQQNKVKPINKVKIMIKKWFVRYADTKNSVEVSKEEYRDIENMAKFYNAFVSDNFGIGHRSKTLKVSFNQHFV